MVEYTFSMDDVFGSLADPTRRDILQRLSRAQLTVGEIAKPYDLTFAAVSKHLKVLEKAQLILKRRRGKEKIVQLAPRALTGAADYLEQYRLEWDERFAALDQILIEEE
jgi:DNA-binding transcriptional ArsR family regulator